MKKKCFTFVEILAVIAIIGILITGTAISINRAYQNNRIDTCESELREMTTAFKNYYTDYGNIIIEPDLNYETVAEETVEILNKKYLPYSIDIKEISNDKKRIKLETSVKNDPWNQKYQLDIYTYAGDDAEGVPGLVVISSNGQDAKSSRENYSENEFGDDIIAVIEPTL